MKRMITAIVLIIAVCAILTACNGAQDKATEAATQPPTQSVTAAKETTKPTLAEESSATQPSATAPAGTQAPTEQEQQPDQSTEQAQEDNMTLRMSIGGTPVEVAWEDNEAVDALRELCKDQALTIDMSMYGGFEQVGSIGSALPHSDVQTTTSAGDIMLYSGDQMVVFYGSNTWAYTPLGHITDKSEDELTQLLANGNVTVTLTY
nr:cyclophilin-like fold protein [uncultured Ruminococcus sp.]